MHDVAAAEALRVFERAGVQDVATLQIDQIQGDRRGAEVHRQTAHLTPVVVDALSAEIDAIVPTDGQRRQRRLAADAVRQNFRLAPQHGKFDVCVGGGDQGLAGKTVRVTQEAFRLGRGVECRHAALDFDNALVALAGSAAGGGHADFQGVGVVENGFAGNGVEPVGIVIHGRHADRFPTFPRHSGSRVCRRSGR